MVVHQHRHGMFPSEYDIREIDEDLYLALLPIAALRHKKAPAEAGGLGDEPACSSELQRNDWCS